MNRELAEFTDADALTAWAAKALPRKNQLAPSDATDVEVAFAEKLRKIRGENGEDQLLPVASPAVVSDILPAAGESAGGEPARLRQTIGRAPGLNGHGGPQQVAQIENGSSQSVTPIGKTLRLRDREHLKFVGTQPCLACGRTPSDAHHLKFAQARALGRKVSDEFVVPLCRLHHRELHRLGDERKWWQQLNIDPIEAARRLWQATRQRSGSISSSRTLPFP